MSEATTIGLDIAKSVFHAHASDAAGKQLFSRRISRGKLLEFIGQQPRCLIDPERTGSIVAMLPGQSGRRVPRRISIE